MSDEIKDPLRAGAKSSEGILTVITALGLVAAELADVPPHTQYVVGGLAALYVIGRSAAKVAAVIMQTRGFMNAARRYKTERNAALDLAERRRLHILKLDPHAYDTPNPDTPPPAL